MNITLWIALSACVAATYIGACNVALKRYSRIRLTDLLDERGQSIRADWLKDRLHSTILMTGVLRAALNMIVLLAVLYEIQLRELGWHVLWHYLLGFLIAGTAISVFSIAIPMSWASYHAETLLARSLPVLRVMEAVFRPLAWMLHGLDPVVRRITGADLGDKDDNEISDEVLSVVEDHDEAGDIDEAQKEMLEAVFDLPTTDVGEIMTPRTDVNGLEVDSTLEEVKQTVMKFGHSRIPVYEESLDHVAGVLYVKDLIRFVGDGSAFCLRDVLREPFLVPESKKVHELLAEFKARKIHLAIVLDEYGGTAGLVTIEDILEELVGEIQDEYEGSEEEPGITRLDEKHCEVDARVRVDELNDELNLDLPEEEDYDTVGGFVSSMFGHIPEVDESFEFEQCRFVVIEAQRTRVIRVRIEQLETHAASSEKPNGSSRR